MSRSTSSLFEFSTCDRKQPFAEVFSATNLSSAMIGFAHLGILYECEAREVDSNRNLRQVIGRELRVVKGSTVDLRVDCLASAQLMTGISANC